MSENVQHLLDRMDRDEPFDYRLAEVGGTQLAAADERFQRARRSIPVLDRRAAESSVESITSLEDIVALLFSHTTYKSYPESLVRQGRWDALAAWLDTLSVQRGARDVDFSGVSDLDEWMERLRAAGHYVFASSGTSGKCSLLNQTQQDRDVIRRLRIRMLRWATGAEPDRSRPVFLLIPSQMAGNTARTFRMLAEEFGRPDATYWMSSRPQRISDVNRMGELRQAIARNQALPSEMAAFEQAQQQGAEQVRADAELLIDAVVAHRDEPAMLLGIWSQHWQVAEALRARGIDGLHPSTAVMAAGGLKGKVLPADYREQIQAAYGVPWSGWQLNYAMSEMSSHTTACHEMRFHIPPWLIPVVLDKSGEHLATPVEGRVEGRMGFLDLAVSGRWGGVISGDRVVVDLRPCPCGRSGPTVVEINRYSDLPEGDDKLTCAGTIDAYIRGAIVDA